MVRKHLIGLFLNGGTSEKPDWVRVKKATQLTPVSYTHLTLPTKRIV